MDRQLRNRTLNKYNKRAKGANKMHQLNHAGLLLILLIPLMKQIRKKFEFKAGTFEQTTLSCLLIEFLKSSYQSSKVETWFFKNGYEIKNHYTQRWKCEQLGLMVKNEHKKYEITDKGHEVIAFACRASIRSVGVLRVLLAEYIEEDEELFV